MIIFFKEETKFCSKQAISLMLIPIPVALPASLLHILFTILLTCQVKEPYERRIAMMPLWLYMIHM
jgi:hypothetical protein